MRPLNHYFHRGTMFDASVAPGQDSSTNPNTLYANFESRTPPSPKTIGYSLSCHLSIAGGMGEEMDLKTSHGLIYNRCKKK